MSVHPPTTVIPPDEISSYILETILSYDDELRSISTYLSDNPELAFEEFKAHDRLCEFLEAKGFATRRKHCLETSFEATYAHGHGGRTWAFNSEYDALPNIGHACGHNLIAISGVAAFLGLSAAMKKFDFAGKVVLIGTPAEEGRMGKDIMLERGAYDGIDACMMLHPGQYQAGYGGVKPSMSAQFMDIDFRGVAAHAAGNPWAGKNALDAAVLAYSSIACLRQHIQTTERVHCIITHGGDAVNVVPELASLRCCIRSTTVTEMKKLTERVVQCFNGAATVTGTQIEIKYDRAMWDLRQCKSLGEQYAATMKEMFGIQYETLYHDWSKGGASTDFGNVTYRMPGCHPHFGITYPPGGGSHTRAFEAAARSKEAHGMTLKAATGIACVGARFLRDDSFAAETQAWHEWDMKAL